MMLSFGLCREIGAGSGGRGHFLLVVIRETGPSNDGTGAVIKGDDSAGVTALAHGSDR